MPCSRASQRRSGSTRPRSPTSAPTNKRRGPWDADTARRGLSVTRDELEEVVSTSDKQRFELSDDGTRIRARQGHSVEVDLGYAPAAPPERLFHGTHPAALSAIRTEGLRKRGRHHVHLSPDANTARRVGSRRGAPVVLVVDARGLASTGAAFFRTGNDVWLVDAVPPAYLTFPD